MKKKSVLVFQWLWAVLSLFVFFRDVQAVDIPKVIRIGVATGGVGTPVRIGGTSTAVLYAEHGLETAFASQGTKVEWIFFKGAGPAVNEALVNNQIDFAWQGDLPSIVHRSLGVKTKILLGSGVRGGLYLAVTPQSGIQRLEDVRGKKVAVFKGTNLHLAALRALASRGIKERDVRFINIPNGEAALASGDVDAVFGYLGGFLLQEQGQAKVVWSAHDDSYNYTRQAALLVTESFEQQYPDAVQKVVSEIVRYARQYSDESRREALFATWGQAEYPDSIWRKDFLGQPLKVRMSPLLDPFLIARYKEAAQQAYELKLIRSVPDTDNWFEPKYLQQALKGLGLQNYWPVYDAAGKLKS